MNQTDEPMHNYTVTYKINGIEEIQKVEAPGVGEAFAKTKKQFPECVLIKCLREGHTGGHGWTEWEAPKNQEINQHSIRPARALRKHEHGCEFPFYDSVKQPVPNA